MLFANSFEAATTNTASPHRSRGGETSRTPAVNPIKWPSSSVVTRPLIKRHKSDIAEIPPPKTIRKLCRFLGMLKFYRPHIAHAASAQAPLNVLLQGP